MALEIAFDAELWQHDGEGGWHFATLPAPVAEEVREAAPQPGGFGSVRVTVTLGTSTWATSLFPDARSGSYVLPVKRAVRRDNDLEAGDVVRVVLRLRGGPE